jgi:hypothetical protein
MSLIVIVRIGAGESPEVGFIPTLQLEEHELPRTTIIPFDFSRESAKETYEEAVVVAEREAKQIINRKYPKGTKYRIEAEKKAVTNCSS